MNTTCTSQDLDSMLQICRDIELYCAKIYHLYAEGYAADHDLGNLWVKTAAEEENHARQFEMAKNLRREGIIVSMDLDKVQGIQVLNMVKSIHDQVIVRLPSPMDALRSSIRLEKKLSSFHLQGIAVFQDESIKKMFTAMMLADDQHLQRIEEMYQKRLPFAGK